MTHWRWSTWCAFFNLTWKQRLLKHLINVTKRVIYLFFIRFLRSNLHKDKPSQPYIQYRSCIDLKKTQHHTITFLFYVQLIPAIKRNVRLLGFRVLWENVLPWLFKIFNFIVYSENSRISSNNIFFPLGRLATPAQNYLSWIHASVITCILKVTIYKIL